MEFLKYLYNYKEQILSLSLEHVKLTAIAVGFAILIGVPLGILISYVKKLNKPILGLTNVIQAIPSMALLGFSIPLLGIGSLPAIVMVTLYSLLPIIKNTYIGISGINPQTIEAAKGIGLSKVQRLFKIQIPLALPVIMAGVRISAVTAVGLMTMAAFIGAGGLGFLIFSGIRTVNNYQILAGAIPACILALCVDYFVASMEKFVTPISLQPGASSQSRKDNGLKKKIVMGLSSIIIVVMVVTSIAGSFNKNEKVIRIASKDFTEQHILAHLFADIIEDRTDISVDRKMNLGGTQVCFLALRNGDVDMYIDYSGTAYGDTLNYPPIADMEEVYNTVKADFKELYDIDVLKQIGFNNTYILAVKEDMADKYNIRTISDLKYIAKDLRAGTTFEFLNREDGMQGLVEAYDFAFKDVIGLDGATRYIALDNDETEVIDAFATDGLLKKFELKALEDDKNFFPPYYAIPLVRAEVLEKYPEIVPIIEEVGDILNDDIMVELNYKVDVLQMEPDEVAREFLIDAGLIN